jgi:hypothetical protein
MPKVGDGDCAVSIADRLGCNDYHSVWDDGANSALKGLRPNPNQLVAGDDVNPPVGKTKTVGKAVDSTWSFVVKRKKPPKLNIVIVDKDDKPLAGSPWRLTAPKAASGKTKADGMIEITDLDPQAKDGALQVDWRKSKAPKKSAAKEPKITNPVYPRPIKAAEFKDANPAAPLPGDDTMEWALKIGSLPAFDHIGGVQARLNNLGFRCDPGVQAARTPDDVKTYQRTRLKDKAPSGLAKDIQADIRDRHDNP